MNNSTFNDDNNTVKDTTTNQQANLTSCVNNKTSNSNTGSNDRYFGIIDGVTPSYVLGYN